MRPGARRPHARATSAVAVVLLGLLGVLSACAGPGDPGDLGGPADAAPADDPLVRRATAVAADLAALPGVEEAAPGWLAAPPVDGPDTRTVAFDVRTGVATAADVTGTASAALDVLVDADVPGSVRVWQQSRTGFPGVAVTLGTGDPAAVLLATTAQLLALPGLTDVAVAADSVSLTLSGPSALPTVAETTARLATGTLMVGTADQRLSTVVPPGVLDGTLATTLAELLARPEVTSVFLGTAGGADQALRVQVGSGSAQVAVAQLLAARPPGATPVSFSAATAFGEVTGTVGAPLAAGALDASPPAATTWPADPGAPPCTGADLEVRVHGGDAALGRRFLLLAARNTGPVPCAVEGTPAVEFWRASGTPALDVETGTPPGTAAPGRIVVPAGGAVYAELQWGAMSTALDPDVTVALGVRAVRGADAVRLEVPAEAGGPLDVLAGAAVAVGPWQQTPAGWQVG
jgi:hypothetical protein